MTSTLHVITDPLCGWCFGAAPLLKGSQKVPDLKIQLHFGGLFTAPNNQVVDEAMIRYIMSHHERITQLTGQTPGAALSNLLNTGDAVLDSTPPIHASLAAGLIGGDTLSYYQAIVKAHFMDGRRVTEIETLRQIAAECEIDAEEFQQAYYSLDAEQVAQHINDSRILLQRVGGRGFPTFALEQNSQIKMLNHQTLYNDPTGWQQSLEDMLSSQLTH